MNIQPIQTTPQGTLTPGQGNPLGASRQPDNDPAAALREAQSASRSGGSEPADPMEKVSPVPMAEQKQKVEEATKDVQRFVDQMTNNLKFSLDDESGRTVVKVIDRQTDEVLRQIPAEEMLEISRVLGKLKGLLVEQQA